MRSSCIQHLVQMCMLSGKAYHGSVFELKDTSWLQAYWLCSTCLVQNLRKRRLKLGGSTNWEGKRQDWTLSSVRGNGASTQAAACQALEDAHGDVHERAEIEEQVVEGVDRQAPSFICIL